MTDNVILGYFCKSGPWSHLSRRFHNLQTREQKEWALKAIAAGMEPGKAIRMARTVKPEPMIGSPAQEAVMMHGV